MQATNDELNFLKGKHVVKNMTFFGDSVQLKPKVVNDIYEFPDTDTFEKAQKMSEELKSKYPKMKPARIARKVAEHFHLNKKQ